MRRKSGTAEQRAAAIAREQHGNATRVQLLDAGLSRSAIDRRVRKGLLIVQHPGVYRVGHDAPSVEATYMAAVLACGAKAVLCGRAAAHLQELVRGDPPRAEVIAPVRRNVEGVTTHRSEVDARERTTHRGIPVTTVARTLLDLAAVLGPAALARACHEAGVRYRTTPRQVRAVLDRHPNAPGRAMLREVVEGRARVTLSKLEAAFLQLLDKHRLPLPQTNRVAGGRRVDCRWPELKLTVELDSFTFHNSRHAWEQDRRREREAHSRGDDFRRYTYGDVMEDPRWLLRELADLLGRAG